MCGFDESSALLQLIRRVVSIIRFDNGLRCLAITSRRTRARRTHLFSMRSVGSDARGDVENVVKYRSVNRNALTRGFAGEPSTIYSRHPSVTSFASRLRRSVQTGLANFTNECVVRSLNARSDKVARKTRESNSWTAKRYHYTCVCVCVCGINFHVFYFGGYFSRVNFTRLIRTHAHARASFNVATRRCPFRNCARRKLQIRVRIALASRRKRERAGEQERTKNSRKVTRARTRARTVCALK